MIHDWKKTKRAKRIKFELYMATSKRFKEFRGLLKQILLKNKNGKSVL